MLLDAIAKGLIFYIMKNAVFLIKVMKSLAVLVMFVVVFIAGIIESVNMVCDHKKFV